MGNQATFRCSSRSAEESIQWYYTALSSNVSQQVAAKAVKNATFGARFAVAAYGRNYDLTITNVAPEDAGTYKCEETGTQASSSAQLGVIG